MLGAKALEGWKVGRFNPGGGYPLG